MLTPEYYETLTDDLVALYADLDEAIIADITRRILKTGRMTESAKWQVKQLQESGFLYDDILAEIAKRTDATENHVRTLFEDAGVKSVEIDNTFYHAAEISGIVRLSDAALQTMNAGYLKCSGNLKNLTLTTANTSQQMYINACNSAYMQVTSGAFDYNTAIRNAIKKCAEDGAYVLYPSGHTDRVDVAVRRAVLTGVGQTCREISKVNAEDMDCDIMEITAHAGARPTHAEWQGQLVSLSGKNAGKIIEGRKVLSLSDIGYGTGDGFGGWNCRHDWHPFFIGISKRAYSNKRLKELDAKNIEYNGKKYNQYEISQIQRKFEREIRAAKREKVAFEVALKEADSADLKQVMQDSLNYSKSVLGDKQARMRDFIQQTGQLRDYAREQNYGRVAYAKNSQNPLTNSINSGIILSNKGSFRPAPDVSAAEKFAREILGIPNVSYRGVDIVTANEWNRGLSEAFEMFSELKKNFGFVGTCQERNRLLEIKVREHFTNKHSINVDKISSNEILNNFIDWNTEKYMENLFISIEDIAHSCSFTGNPDFPEFHGITISKIYGADSKKFISLLNQNVSTGFHPVGCNTIKSMLDHEVGHQLDTLLDLRNNVEIQMIFDVLDSDEIKNMLSIYSIKNNNSNHYAEMIAEAWSEYCNNPNPRIIAKSLGDMIKKIYKDRFSS